MTPNDCHCHACIALCLLSVFCTIIGVVVSNILMTSLLAVTSTDFCFPDVYVICTVGFSGVWHARKTQLMMPQTLHCTRLKKAWKHSKLTKHDCLGPGLYLRPPWKEQTIQHTYRQRAGATTCRHCQVAITPKRTQKQNGFHRWHKKKCHWTIKTQAYLLEHIKQ